MTKVLFVCMGNICRSPTAEGIFRQLVDNAKLGHLFEIDSAGTTSYHEGEPPDARMSYWAEQRGYKLQGSSRGLDFPKDFDYFDKIIGMDQHNMGHMMAQASNPDYHHKLLLMTDFCKIHSVEGVPDPYYQGDEGFRLVMDILEDSCQELFGSLTK